MAILKNIDIAKKFGVSPATVKNWITYAKQEKIQLDLTKIMGRFFIKDTQQNLDRLTKLKTKGVKFRSRSKPAEIHLNPVLYECFDDEQIYELMNSLKHHSYIPKQYFDYKEGARLQYDSILDSFEAGKYTKHAVTNIGVNVTSSVINIYNKCENKDGLVINIFESVGDVGSHIISNLLTELTNRKINYNYIIVSRSEDFINLKRIYLKKFYNKDIKVIKADFFNIQRLQFSPYLSNDSVNFFIFPLGYLCGVVDANKVLLNVKQILRPNIDYVIVDIDISDHIIDHKKHTANSNLAVMQHKYIFFFKYLNIFNYCENVVYERTDNRQYVYKYLSANNDISINFKIGEENHIVEIKKDQKIVYNHIKKFTISETLELLKTLGFELEQYFFTKEDSSGLFVFTTRSFINDKTFIVNTPTS